MILFFFLNITQSHLFLSVKTLKSIWFSSLFVCLFLFKLVKCPSPQVNNHSPGYRVNFLFSHDSDSSEDTQMFFLGIWSSSSKAFTFISVNWTYCRKVDSDNLEHFQESVIAIKIFSYETLVHLWIEHAGPSLPPFTLFWPIETILDL